MSLLLPGLYRVCLVLRTLAAAPSATIVPLNTLAHLMLMPTRHMQDENQAQAGAGLV